MTVWEFDYHDTDGVVLADIRELLYLLVTVADLERDRGTWPALVSFQEQRMVNANKRAVPPA